MGMENDEITIDLMDLFQVVFKKLHLVLLAGIIAALVAVLVTKLFMTPVYTSTTKMYVLSKQDANSAVTSSDLQAGSQLTKERIAASKAILDYMQRQNCLVMVASHDYELTVLLEGTYENYHFTERIGEDDKLNLRIFQNRSCKFFFQHPAAYDHSPSIHWRLKSP